eukprot:jgi/Astpho2/9011/Aster-02678
MSALQINMASGQGLHDCFDTLKDVDVVVNCAALSSPAACAKHPQHARAVNVPAKLIDALDVYSTVHEKQPLLVHLSTDQVYHGSKSWWREDDETSPINDYGLTKRDAELLIQERWPCHVILRSSIMYGPQSAVPVSRTLFLQFVSSALSQGKSATFFSDEFRCPIYVQDIVQILQLIVERSSEGLPNKLYNLGGEERLSRLRMAEIIAEQWKLSGQIVAAASSSVDRGLKSPADISMDISRLKADLNPHLTPFAAAIDQIGSMSEPLDMPPARSIERLGQ